MQKRNENAADRYSYVGEVYSIGARARKNEILQGLAPSWKALHEKGYIHIHDLDAYGLTYNCLTFNLLEDFPYDKFKGYSIERKIVAYFDYLKSLFSEMGNEQSGGMALANYDIDTAKIFTALHVDIRANEQLIKACTVDLIEWCNNTHTRMGHCRPFKQPNDMGRIVCMNCLSVIGVPCGNYWKKSSRLIRHGR